METGFSSLYIFNETCKTQLMLPFQAIYIQYTYHCMLNIKGKKTCIKM